MRGIISVLIACAFSFLLPQISRADEVQNETAVTASGDYDIVNGPHGEQWHTGLKVLPRRLTGQLHFSPKISRSLPESYDSRVDGFVPPVKDQGNCGSCWAFSMTRAFEGALMLANHGQYTDLAEQDWVSNDNSNSGCGGGSMDASFAVDSGLVKEADCPYQARSSVRCRNGAEKTKALSWGFVGAEGRSPTLEELKQAIYQYKVLSVDVAAGSGFGSPNSAGIITGCGARGINHMVDLVGWKKIDGVDYLIVSNSWGTDWGMEGFAYSKQGCNLLASTDDSALFVVAAEGPSPLPPMIRLPSEISIIAGTELALGVRSQPGVTYKWSTGETTPMIFVSPSADTLYSLQATNSAGTATSSVQVKVLASEILN